MSLDRTGEGLGIARQENECRALCERLGLVVGEVFADNDVSATKGKLRPSFERLLASQPECIVVWHTDRLVRLTRDLERVIDLGVNVHAVTAGDLDLSNPAGRAVARTITAWATYEGEQKGERQRASARQRAKAGQSWWSSRPFGYESDGTLRTAEAEALAVAYRQLLTGASLRTVAASLNEAGHLTCRGNTWTATTLRPVLLNARNAGIRVYEGEEVGPASWAAVVPEETFRAAERLLTDPARRTGGGGGVPRNLLTGLAVCGKCGGTVKAAWRGTKGTDKAYSVYVCRESSCVSHRTTETDDFVLLKAAEVLASQRHREWMAGQDEAAERDTVALREEEATLAARLEDLAEAFADGAFVKASDYAAATAKIRERLEQVTDALATVGSAARLSRFSGLTDVEPILAELDEMTGEERRAAVADVLESVTLLPRGRGIRGFTSEHVVIRPKHDRPEGLRLLVPLDRVPGTHAYSESR